MHFKPSPGIKKLKGLGEKTVLLDSTVVLAAVDVVELLAVWPGFVCIGGVGGNIRW